jgi:hypothetical protein
MHILSYSNRVGIATGYKLDGRGSIPGRGRRFMSSPQGPDRLPYPMGMPGYFSGDNAAGA